MNKQHKAKDWNGKDLEGLLLLTYKIDGVRVIVKNGIACSRTGKKLYNVPALEDGDYECFLGTFKETISKLKTQDLKETIDRVYFYSLDPVDKRLIYDTLYYTSLSSADIKDYLNHVVSLGYEGLVIRNYSKWIKVKKQITHDTIVEEYQEGSGKYKNKMGALITKLGKIGTGFTDKERQEFTKEFIVGKTIEVAGMELTEKGKLRHPRFIRLRQDKD